jgi:hypothetical protein
MTEPAAARAHPPEADDTLADEFARLQAAFPDQFGALVDDPLAPRTVVILPSLTLDAEILARITGAIHYEQRLLCLLFLLRYPRARVIYLTSQPIPGPVVDYYLHLLDGIPHDHARRRLSLMTCYDDTPVSLTEKILARPRMLGRLRREIGDPSRAHLTCFNVTRHEQALAVQLGIPLYGCDPALGHLGTKSGARTIFKRAGIAVPDGAEDLRDAGDVAGALAAVKARNPSLGRAVVKLNDGFSGEGNAIFGFDGAPEGGGLDAWIRDRLPRLDFVARDLDWAVFEAKLGDMGGIVEAFVEGRGKRTPSVQYRVDPLGDLTVVSTHDQVTGGLSEQVFEGCRFPADKAYRLAIQEAGQGAAEILAREGVLGRFGIDFISVPEGDGWTHYALEINLRKGGTTHPFLMLQHLTNGAYEPATGVYHSLSGRSLCYYASDNLQAPQYRGLTPDDLVDIAVENGLHFNAIRQEGVAFHMMAALSSYGKMGLTCVGGTMPRAERLYRDTVAAIDRATGAR